MTIKEAILQSLEDRKEILNYLDIYNHIIEKRYYDFKDAKTPASTVSALLGDFIRKGDSRIRRINQSGGNYSYYLAKYEQNINTGVLPASILLNQKKVKDIRSYDERDLHKLLSTFLKSIGINSKTIFHERSLNSKDDHQKWVHPDMVGISFLDLHTEASQTFLKAINRTDTFKITSYEIKKEINTDYDLKKTFFQAVSNSSWANYGYLVAFSISDSLHVEMERLNQSFGIGIIELKANPFETKIHYVSKYKALDFQTIDKLCVINKDFEKFIEQVEKVLTANEKYIKPTKRELEEFCDSYLTNETDVMNYCTEKNIPFEVLSESIL